ncbi:hypothetical protein D9C73_010517 [Collichthys lucidus]|uniref:Uncharacterized protein n=1 Tax=Collichthys lucidus TaxID=240159 RepID=A0A4U5UKE0_COLLU|nr:hypothetical protein D9C73_010517 [Collichthys lucidus]
MVEKPLHCCVKEPDTSGLEKFPTDQYQNSCYLFWILEELLQKSKLFRESSCRAESLEPRWHCAKDEVRAAALPVDVLKLCWLAENSGGARHLVVTADCSLYYSSLNWKLICKHFKYLPAFQELIVAVGASRSLLLISDIHLSRTRASNGLTLSGKRFLVKTGHCRVRRVNEISITVLIPPCT